MKGCHTFSRDDPGLLFAPGDLVALPCCGFAFSVDHSDEGSNPETYTCPLCSKRDPFERIADALEKIASAFEITSATDTKPTPPAGVTIAED